MDWQQFTEILASIGYWLLLWLFVSIPTGLILLAVARFFISEPGPASRIIFKHRPSLSEASTKFKEGRMAARQALEARTVRVVLDKKHLRLKRELSELRTALDRRLQKITQASLAPDRGSLVEMLLAFKSDTERALQFSEIEDNLVDQVTARSKARFIAVILTFFALVITMVNGALLYLFFDQTTGGSTVPFLSIPLALILAGLFPIAETAAGIGSELALDKVDSPGVKISFLSAMALLVIALGSVEFLIFFELFATVFSAELSFETGGSLHMLVGLAGPALTAVQGALGFGIARNILVLLDIGAVKSIKDDVKTAQKFVDGLEQRYDRIDAAAARASRSIEEFVSSVKGRGEAAMSAANVLGDAREKFIESIDAVNPARWNREAEAGAGDRNAAYAYTWFLPIMASVLVFGFIGVFGPIVAKSGLFSGSVFSSLLIASAVAVLMFAAGGGLFDRATSAIDSEMDWKDVLAPRDGTFRLASLVIFSALALGIFWICVALDGILGVGEAIILIAILYGIGWISSYMDLFLQGLKHIAVLASDVFLWLWRFSYRLLWLLAVFLAAALVGLVLFVLQIIALPFNLIRSAIEQRQKTEFPAKVNS